MNERQKAVQMTCSFGYFAVTLECIQSDLFTVYDFLSLFTVPEFEILPNTFVFLGTVGPSLFLHYA